MNLSVHNQSTSPAVHKTEMAGKIADLPSKGANVASSVESAGLQLHLTTVESAEKAWIELIEWKPRESQTPTQNVQELKARYLALKNYLIETTSGVEQAQQLAQLESLLVEHVETLMKGQYGELVQFLFSGHQESAILAVRFSLLFFLQGKTAQENPVWPAELAQQEKLLHKTLKSQVGAAAKQPEYSGMMQYGRNGKMNTHMQPLKMENSTTLPASSGMQSYGSDGKINMQTSYMHTSVTRGTGTVGAKTPGCTSGVSLVYAPQKNSIKSVFPKPFTLMELAKTMDFARHMNRYGIVSVSAAEQIEKEEWLGVQAGVTWLKGQLFAEVPGVGTTAAHMIQTAVDQQISSSLRQAVAVLKNEPCADAQKTQCFAPLKHDAVFSVFNHLVGNFEKHHDAKSSIMSSIFYMIEVLKTKERDENYQGVLRYHKPTERPEGVVCKTADGYLNENRNWFQQLKNSWNQFVKDMHLRSDSGLDFRRFQEQYAIWAQSVPPVHKLNLGLNVSWVTILSWCGAAVFVVVLLQLFLRH